MKSKQEIIGYIIKTAVCTEANCYIGSRGAIMPRPSQNKKVLFSSIEDARRYIRTRLRHKEVEVVPVYKADPVCTPRIERTEIWVREPEELEFITRKRPQVLRKDKFRNTNKDGTVHPSKKRGTIRKLR